MRHHPHTHRCYNVRFGWCFGSKGPAVAHAPAHVKREAPGSWIWFCSEAVAFVTNSGQPEPLTPEDQARSEAAPLDSHRLYWQQRGVR